MGTYLFNAVGFKVLDQFEQWGSINQIKLSIQTQSVSAKPSLSKSSSTVSDDPIVAQFNSIRKADLAKHSKHFQHKPLIDYSVRTVV